MYCSAVVFPALTENDLLSNPLDQFLVWYDAAQSASDIRNPEAACLSTVSEAGLPEGRMLLIKFLEEKRFIFFTNLGSPKVKSIRHHPVAALTFYWASLGRQVRVTGVLTQVSRDFANDYFQSRPIDSQIGANVSQQSRELASREALIDMIDAYKAAHQNQIITRPVFWSGFELVPDSIEFWQEGDARLHDRFLYRRDADIWTICRLFP